MPGLFDHTTVDAAIASSTRSARVLFWGADVDGDLYGCPAPHRIEVTYLVDFFGRTAVSAWGVELHQINEGSTTATSQLSNQDEIRADISRALDRAGGFQAVWLSRMSASLGNQQDSLNAGCERATVMALIADHKATIARGIAAGKMTLRVCAPTLVPASRDDRHRECQMNGVTGLA